MRIVAVQAGLFVEPGTLELSENMRLDRTTARPRAGIYPAVSDLVLTNPPVVFDFTFGVDISVTITRAGAVATATTRTAVG